MAPKLGLTWRDDRREVVGYVNRMRNLLFNRYDRLQLFDNVQHCFRPHRFRTKCGSGALCNSNYLGFTLPRYMAGIVSAWEYGLPLTIQTSWREHFFGKLPAGNRLEIIELPGDYPTEREVPNGKGLQMFADSFGDTGKVAVVEIKDIDGNIQGLRFDLQGNAWIKHPTVQVAEVLSVVLPPDLTGSVVLADDAGYELSIYAPGEHVPAYKRYGVPSTCRGNILVQATQRFTPVYFDCDVVEVGDQLVIEAFGRYFRFYESKDNAEQAQAQLNLNEAYQQIDGILSRDSGGNVPKITITPRGRLKLPGRTKLYPR